MASDDAVRATNDDAAQCKRFAVEKGYWQDPYIPFLTPRGQAKHAPEINRGYYARVSALRSLLKKFLHLNKQNCQIINIGAGFDTTYWILKDEGLGPKSYVEVDFDAVTSRKIYNIKRVKALLEKMATDEDGEIKLSLTELHASDYHLVSANLRNPTEVEKKLEECGIDKNLPTVFVAECVLVYMDTKYTNELLKWIAEQFKTVLFLNYEQVNMHDRFGQVMIDNLKSRDCILSGVEDCTSLDTQKQRFTNNGWEGADGMEMTHVYNCLPQVDIQRIERIEFMDERELLDQLFSHYCIVWAWKDPDNIGLADVDLT